MDRKNEFYRNAYYDVSDQMNNKAFIVLTGPWRVGKTFAMKQLQKNFGGEYYNFKTMSTDKSDDVLDRIYTVVRDNEKANIYLDEIIYLDDFEHCLEAIAEAATLTMGSAEYHIVVAGSQQIYIENAMRHAFGARAGMVQMDFISFTEYYDYIRETALAQSAVSEIETQILEEAYQDYLFNDSAFNCMSDGVEVYLKNCLDEAMRARSNSCFKNNAVQVDEINVQSLKSVAYMIIKNLTDRIVAIDEANFDAAVLKNYKLDDRMSKEKQLDCVRFLYQCKLVNITEHNPESQKQLDSFFNGIYEKWSSVDAFFSQYSVTFAYPHFLVRIMQDMCENLDIEKKNAIIGALENNITLN